MPTHEPKDPAHVPSWPVYALAVQDDGRVVAFGPQLPTSAHPTRDAAIGAVAAAAARLGRPVRADATEADGTVWHLAISPAGAVAELSGGGSRVKTPKKRAAKRPARSVSTGTAPEPTTDPGTYAASMAQIRRHLEAGRIGQAAALATRLDEQAAAALGLSHPDALRIREVLARITALAGDIAGGVRLYRDIAERWHYQGDGERSETVAALAETLWLQITDRDTALSVGNGVIRMRNLIPGEHGEALSAVVTHRAWLEEPPGTGVPWPPERSEAPAPAQPPEQPPEQPPAPVPVPRPARPVPDWERPPVQERTATAS